MSSQTQLPTFLRDIKVSRADHARFDDVVTNSTVVLEFMREYQSDLKLDDYLKMMRIAIETNGSLSVLRRIMGKYDKVRRRQEELEIAMYLNGSV